MDQGINRRPAVLDDATETQIQELENQFNEQDRDAWNALTNSYGWTSKQGQEVWTWFSAGPDVQSGIEAQPQMGGETF